MLLRRRSLSVVAGAALFVAIAFSGCGDKSNPVSAGGSSLVGTWNMTTLTMGGMTLTAGTSTVTTAQTFNSNNTYSQITVDYLNTPVTRDTTTGTWATSGSKLITTTTGTTGADTGTYAISGNQLTVSITDTTMGTMTMVFARQ